MEIVRVNGRNISKFVKYCKENRDSLDDTFLIDEELDKLMLDSDDPSFMAIDAGRTIGAVSLKMDAYLLRGKRARFRIFHSNSGSTEVYRRLFSAIKPEMERVEKVFIFVPEKGADLRSQLVELGFTLERYAYLLIRKAQMTPKVALPVGYSLTEFVPGTDEKAYCQIRNAAFSALAGSETPLTIEEVKKIYARPDYLPGGILFLYHAGSPVGIVRVAREYYNGNHYALIGPIALLPEYQKKGLGRQLLRAGLAAGRTFGLDEAILSVNAENEQAVRLYVSEGFETDECFVSYIYFI
ncbi:GNAT family N-acetyltransferase [Bacillus sp. FJAT-27445]|uniref:GNAT family N-acetyltransferase n=1 Tax=Bacillus sp. FJAT-27445 TaxID=1679166 RepID=UPI000743D248|nr:GNAT family N-acetyltransferase [Bacillus sp. FJAT-27445]